jgi:hypothetical protein
MNKLFPALAGLLILFLAACSDADIPAVDGLWQLNSIQANGRTTPVDTLYFSFMLKRSEFSFITLHEHSLEAEQAETRYGYALFPSKNQIRIEMDKGQMYSPVSFPWNALDVDFLILHLSRKKMTLQNDDTQYHLTKF